MNNRRHNPEFERRPLNFTFACKISPCLNNHDFVEGILTSSSLSVLYGEPGVGKTFLVIDLAMCIASGCNWLDRKVDQGAVLYIAGEGQAGVRNRVSAWRMHHKGEIVEELPFALTDRGIDLLTSDHDVSEVIDVCQRIREATNKSVRLVVVDTLSRAMAGGNENSSDDMGLLVQRADKIREGTGAHVLLVHHSGKDRTNGARGHSLLKAAINTEIEVQRTGDISIVRVVKQRDLPVTSEMAFQLEQVTLGCDERNNPVTSCIVTSTTFDPFLSMTTAKDARLRGQPKRALELLTKVVDENGVVPPACNEIPAERRAVREERWREECRTARLATGESESGQRQAFARAQRILVDRGLVAVWGGWIWQS